MNVLLIATNNPGKVIELQALLGILDLKLVTPAEIGIDLDVEETGSTYAENAALKAVAFGQASGLLTLADDSGLEVDSLDGEPGLHSRRYSPVPGATDADRRQYLLAHLASKPRPWTARFRCSIAILESEQAHSSTPHIYYAEGTCPGEIIPEERGENGFGYDPIFLLSELKKTM
ncbi:MAG TPA: non-canonical purine NTP pyrophosphatase, partial [Anaerolineales bacterium]|nr:non-canonical purine NTP pyrophosphatase [Anaerolineales bacterium]